MLIRSTITRPFSGSTRRTLPFFPRSFPAITITVSPFRTWACAIRAPHRMRRPRWVSSRPTVAHWSDPRGSSDDLGGQRDDLGELPVAELPGHRTEDARAHRVVV